MPTTAAPALRSTRTSAGTYSGYFEKDIWVAGNCVGCTMAYVAVNSGEEPLAAGDLVAADGVRKPLTQGAEPVLAVRRATGGATGVVAGRAVLVVSTRDGETSVGALTAEGRDRARRSSVHRGVWPGESPCRCGRRAHRGRAAPDCGLATAGSARALRTVSVEGVAVAEAAAIIGVALEPLPAGQGLIWVLVNPQ